jgi:hypothetical protein
MWLEWVRVVRDSSGSVLYSIPDLLFVLLPVVAWVGRRASPGAEGLADAAGSATGQEGPAAILGAP